MDDRAKQIAALLDEYYHAYGIGAPHERLRAAVAAVLAPLFEDIAALKAERKPSKWATCAKCGEPIVGIPRTNDLRGFVHKWCPRDEQPELVSQSGVAPICHVCGQGAANPIATAKGPAHLSCAAEGTAPEQPGATRGAEVAERMIVTFAANVRWICEKAIEAERAAARREAIEEAEAAVRAHRERHQPETRWAIDAIAGEVARLREVPAQK